MSRLTQTHTHRQIDALTENNSQTDGQTNEKNEYAYHGSKLMENNDTSDNDNGNSKSIRRAAAIGIR